jgi:hypothetical protein
MKCTIHSEFFEDSCSACKQEYMELKRIDEVGVTSNKKYKEFTEERAKKLYEELLLQYLRSGASEVEADQKAKAIIKKQCNLRKMPFWSWL